MPAAYLKARFSSLPGRYARALYTQLSAAERSEVLQQLSIVLICLREVGSFKRILCNEYSSMANVRALVSCISDVLELNTKVKNLFFVLQEYKRFKILPEIIGVYKKLYESAYKTSSVVITVSHELTEVIQKKIFDKLKNIFSRNIDATYQIDPSILGGIVIQNDQYIIDMSLESQLKAMKRSLKS